jgi:hypothetical protein
MNADHGKTVVDVLAVTGTVATIMKWLPAVAAGMSILWLGIRIFEWIEGRWFGGKNRPTD